jgi:hypothetical protein
MLIELPVLRDVKLQSPDAQLREAQSQVMDVRKIWASYRSGDFDERQLLMGLGRQVLAIAQPAGAQDSQLMMAEMLTRAVAVTKNEAADAIEAFLAWARDNAIAVVDQVD